MTAIALRPRNDWRSRLRTIMVLRPGQRILNIPGYGVTTSRRAVRQPAPPASVHVEDSFTAANGTNLNGRAPDVANTPGNNWAAVVQNWSIISARARGTNYQFSVLVIDCGIANGVITMPCARGNNQNGIVFRYVDTSNYWYISTSASGFRLIEVSSGTETIRASNVNTDEAIVTMTVTLSGNDITANWKSIALTYTSSQHATATKHGIMRQQSLDDGVAEWWKAVS